MVSEMSEKTSRSIEDMQEDELLDQVLTAMELAIGHKYVGHFPEKSMTRIKRVEPDNSILLDLYSNNPGARQLIDTYLHAAPEELVIKLGLPPKRGG